MQISNRDIADGVALPRLLIIEDDDSLREFLVEYLGEFFELASRRDGVSGAVAAYEFVPDVILLDLEMPGFGGWDVIRVLTEDDRTHPIPIAILTALDSEAHLRRAEAEGIPYLVKPLRSDRIIDLLLSLVEKEQS